MASRHTRKPPPTPCANDSGGAPDAHATMCDMRSRELIAHRDRLEQELRQLQAENP